MSTTIASTKDFPKHNFYVTATDTFLSGRGDAEGQTNVVVLGCATYAEAETVMANAKGRSDMKRVRIISNPPRVRPGNLYSYMDRDHAKAWYAANTWAAN